MPTSQSRPVQAPLGQLASRPGAERCNQQNVVPIKYEMDDLTQQFRYAALERALIYVFDVPAERRGALNARIKNLAKFGIPYQRRRNCRGVAVAYTFDQAFMLALTLQLAAWRHRPQHIGAAVARHWPAIAAGLERIRAGEEIVLRAQPSFIRARWNGRDPMPMECISVEQVNDDKAAEGWVEYVPLNPLAGAARGRPDALASAHKKPRPLDADGALCADGALAVFGSLCYSGTLTSAGSLSSLGALALCGSLRRFGTLHRLGSLAGSGCSRE
jgi:hypothetical protein